MIAFSWFFNLLFCSEECLGSLGVCPLWVFTEVNYS